MFTSTQKSDPVFTRIENEDLDVSCLAQSEFDRPKKTVRINCNVNFFQSEL